MNLKIKYTSMSIKVELKGTIHRFDNTKTSNTFQL